MDRAAPDADTASAMRWRLGLAYLLTRPALARDGLAHGVELSAGGAPLPWLVLGLGLQYAAAADGDLWRQHRVAATAWAAAGLQTWSWLRLATRLDLGYLALLESVRGEDRGDAAAFTLALRAGPELRLHRRLTLLAKGGLVLDVFHQDDKATSRVAPMLWAGLATWF